MKNIRFIILAAVIALSFVTGYSSARKKEIVLAAEKKNTKITIKPASDFTLKIPAGWKDNYVVKGTKKKKSDSYLGFYSKKCYKQTKEGWLFSIARYKDDSYKDNMPAYELVGEWDGIYYVAIFPTDVQTEGATKKAKKQYNKLNKSVEKVVRSIRKVGK